MTPVFTQRVSVRAHTPCCWAFVCALHYASLSLLRNWLALVGPPFLSRGVETEEDDAHSQKSSANS